MPHIQDAISTVKSKRIRYVDVRLEARRKTTFECHDGVISRLSIEDDKGTSSRAFIDRRKLGFCATSDIRKDAIEHVVKGSTAMVRMRVPCRTAFRWETLQPRVCRIPRREEDPALEEILDYAELLGREFTRLGLHSMIRYRNVLRSRYLGDSECSSVAEASGFTTMDVGCFGNRFGNRIALKEVLVGKRISSLLNQGDPYTLAQTMSKELESRAGPKKISPTTLPTIFRGQALGVLVHETLCHRLEARIQGPPLDLIGSSVASEKVTVVDNPSHEDGITRYTYDDEGIRASCTTLLEEGVIAGHLYDRLTAATYGTVSTGNGRAQYYGDPPSVHGSNTYIAPGDWTFDEMLSENRECLVIDRLSGGGVGAHLGSNGKNFMFGIRSGRRICRGATAVPVAGNFIAGSLSETLNSVQAVQNETSLHPFVCEKMETLIELSQGGAPILTGGVHVI